MVVQKEALQASPLLLEADQSAKTEGRDQESPAMGPKKQMVVVGQKAEV